MLRQDGNYERALSLYDSFTADHPDSPLGRDAELRASLCLELLNRDQLALERFVRVAQENRFAPRYVTLATFHAWACAVRLGRLDEAERFFASLRRNYRTDQLLTNVPEEAARRLVDDHLSRAEALRANDPQRALDLFTAGADVASYLKLPERGALALTGAGDVLMEFDEPMQALERYRSVAENLDMPAEWRTKAELKMAEALRLADRPDEAVAAYRQAAESASGTGMEALAWLWLGDLLAERGERSEAESLWRLAATDAGMAGRFARAMLGTETLTSTQLIDPWYANDDAYFRARLAKRAGDRVTMIEHLRAASTGDWPAPLARRMLR